MVQSRDEEAAPPLPLALQPPTLFRFKSQKCRCLICTLQTGGGHREENPYCQFWPSPSQQGPAGLPTPHRTRSYTNQWLSVPRLYFFSLGFFFPENKAVSRGEAGQSLPWVWVMTCYPFLVGKGGTGTDLLPAFAGHALCYIL